jgi:hypothetical protein
MQPSTAVPAKITNPDHVTVPIHLETNDNPGVGRMGTFTSPPPKLSVKKGDLIKWQITAGQTFQLDFASYTPGPSSPFAQSTITDSDFHEVVVDPPGLFHYTVIVKDTSGNELGKIAHCPEVGVGN